MVSGQAAAAILVCWIVGLATAHGQTVVPVGQRVDCTYVVQRVDGSGLVESQYTAMAVLKPGPRDNLIGEMKTPLGSDYVVDSHVSFVPEFFPPLPQLIVSTWLVSTRPDTRIVGGLTIESSRHALELDYAEARDRIRSALEKMKAVAALEGESKTEVENRLAGALEPVQRRATHAGGNLDNPETADLLAKLAARGQAATLAQALRQGRLPNGMVTGVTVACFHFR
jgi:hypothetical protein